MADEKKDESNEDNHNEDETCDKNIIKNTYTTEERSEYFVKLEKWLQEAYAWQSVAAMFPYHILSGQIFNQPPGSSPFIASITTNVSSSPVTNGTTPLAGTPEWQNIEPVRQRTPQENRVPFQPPRTEGRRS